MGSFLTLIVAGQNFCRSLEPRSEAGKCFLGNLIARIQVEDLLLAGIGDIKPSPPDAERHVRWFGSWGRTNHNLLPDPHECDLPERNAKRYGAIREPWDLTR